MIHSKVKLHFFVLTFRVILINLCICISSVANPDMEIDRNSYLGRNNFVANSARVLNGIRVFIRIWLWNLSGFTSRICSGSKFDMSTSGFGLAHDRDPDQTGILSISRLIYMWIRIRKLWVLTIKDNLEFFLPWVVWKFPKNSSF